MTKNILVTGSTGLLGQYFLRDFLVQGTPIAVLIRGSQHESAQERLDGVLALWEEELGRKLPSPVCLEGDITLPGLGLSPSHRLWVSRHCDAILHSAASLRLFGQDRSKDPWLSNLTGTANVLDFCRDMAVRELHYVSTAYVCGRRRGMVLESELDEGQDFHNDYERCKCEAEKLVRAADHIQRLTVYRPGIIVGDSTTGYTSTYHGLYLYLRWVWLFSQSLPREPDGRYYAPIRMQYSGDESCHVVPVEWVSAAIAYLVAHPETHGRTYHLTQEKPLTGRELEEALGEYFHYYGPTFAGPGAIPREEWTELEQAFNAMCAPYQQYWNPHLDFDAGNTREVATHLPCPRIDAPVLHRLVEFAIKDEWGRLRKKRPRRV
jgi:thioester reductase-like protein